MTIHPALLAPCGLYCGVCAVRMATLDDNPKFKERLVGVYRGKIAGSENLSIEDIHCEGCLSEKPFLYCVRCDIKDCTRKKNYSGCHECTDFPCPLIESFPMPVGKRVMLRAIPHWRAVGTQQWIKDEEARYLCPHCTHPLFRGAKRCHSCGGVVDLDS
jgi:hypothetical protein